LSKGIHTGENVAVRKELGPPPSPPSSWSQSDYPLGSMGPHPRVGVWVCACGLKNCTILKYTGHTLGQIGAHMLNFTGRKRDGRPATTCGH